MISTLISVAAATVYRLSASSSSSSPADFKSSLLQWLLPFQQRLVSQLIERKVGINLCYSSFYWLLFKDSFHIRPIFAERPLSSNLNLQAELPAHPQSAPATTQHLAA